MTKQDAIELEARLSDREQDTTVSREGMVIVTDADGNVTTTHTQYAVADLLELLDRGHSIQTVLSILDN